MPKIVASVRQALANIVRFQVELEAHPELQERLAYVRAWYADRTPEEEWVLAPSKFIGYQDMTGDEYLDDAPRDGRRTEKQLAQWFVQVDEDSDLYDELNDELVEFLALYGKKPSTKMRIGISRELHREIFGDEEPDTDAMIVDLIIAVARRLSAREINRLRNSLYRQP